MSSSDELSTLHRLIVVIESAETSLYAVGNFRVHGLGQWLREALWAATGVLPRDPGAPAKNPYFSVALSYWPDEVIFERPLSRNATPKFHLRPPTRSVYPAHAANRRAV